MTSDSRILVGVAAAAAAIAAAQQLAERDWLRGATGLVVAAVLMLIATGLPERTIAAKRLSYGLLGVVFILLAFRIVGF
jgi:hypothetical protein